MSAFLKATINSITQGGRSIQERLLGWVSEQAEVLQDEDEELEPLPPEVMRSLQAQVHALPNHPRDWCCLQSALNEAIGQWQADPKNCENAIAVLSNPVDTVARLLRDDLLQELEAEVEVQLLPCPDRIGASEMQARLRQACGLDSAEQARASSEQNANPDSDVSTELSADSKAELSDGQTQGAVVPNRIVVIPKLEHCFLRSVDGLDGIEYLRDVLLGDRTRFWIFGSSSISWQYLTKVCDLDAYCLDSFTLPVLTGEELQDWLQPVIEHLPLPLKFESNSLRGHFTEDEGGDALRRDYFRSLSEKAGGNSLVAADLFIQSLAYSSEEAKKEEEEEVEQTAEEQPQSSEPDAAQAEEAAEETAEEAAELQCAVIKARYPDQPKLPDITPDAEYMLYSVLLHNEISLSDLAVSLGAPPREICSTVQALKQDGILQRKHPIQLNSLYFSRIREKLENDNFLI